MKVCRTLYFLEQELDIKRRIVFNVDTVSFIAFFVDTRAEVPQPNAHVHH